MSWQVYVIKSVVDGRLYKGMTEDIVERLKTHNRGRVKSTKAYRPWVLVYTESCKDSKHARERERFLKSGDGRAYLQSVLLG